MIPKWVKECWDEPPMGVLAVMAITGAITWFLVSIIAVGSAVEWICTHVEITIK